MLNPAELAQLSGMTTLTERLSCRDYAAWTYTGQGALVDLGCWLGSTTIPLAAGLAENRHPGTRRRRVQAFDQFVWEEWMEPFVQGTSLEGRFAPGDSFREEFEQRCIPWRDRIDVCPGDLTRFEWTSGPIEFLLIDAMKSWPLANAIARTFLPHLIPGVSLVVHQDFSHYYTSWIHLQMYRLRDYFEPVADVEGSCSLVFRLTRPIPVRLLLRELTFADFSDPEIDRAFALSRSQVASCKHPAIEGARQMTYIHANQPEKAATLLRQYFATGGALTYDIDCVWLALPPRLRPRVPGLGPLAKLYKTWRSRLGRVKRWLALLPPATKKGTPTR